MQRIGESPEGESNSNNEDGTSVASNEDGRDDPNRMVLTPEERQFAMAIKEAVRNDAELDNLPDFYYAQLALLDSGNVEHALGRARFLQAFREEYKIEDNPSKGLKAFRDYVQLQPGNMLSFEYHQRDGNYVMVFDFCKAFFPKTFSRDEGALQTWLSALYFMFHCVSPDLQAIRAGVVLLVECEGFSWTKHFDVHQYRLYWEALGDSYPLKYQQIKHFHTGWFLTMMLSLGKKFVPPEARDSVQVGCKSKHRLDVMCSKPSFEEAQQKMLENLHEALKKRYENEAAFRL